MQQKPAATFEAGTVEHNLLYGRLARPRERVQRGNAHHEASRPRERWRSAVRTVVKDFLPGTQFRYSKIEKGEIRILCIHPGSGTQPLKASLFKRRLEEAFDGYEALSYCWGNPSEKATHEILIRDLNATLPEFKSEKYKPSGEVIFRMAVKATFEIPFPIRRNLHQALVKLRSKDEPVNIWADAICIDQSERGKLEKEEQLSRMADVYNYASNVCIWLGDAFEGASEGFQFVRDIMNLRTFDNLMDTSDSKNRWSHLIEIMNASWFSRRWIIQEVALSRNATIHCANDVIHWDDFADAVSLLIEKIEVLRGKFRDEIFDNVEATSACVLVHILTNVCRKSDRGQVVAMLLDLETLVSTLLGFQATFPRDTIYSIMSLARDLPQSNEKWEDLHANQLKSIRVNGELTNGKQPELHATLVETKPKKVIGLTPNYKVSTRDLFVAFVTRCIERSRCLDIICRHWAPPVTDMAFGEEVLMPSWISGISKAPYGIPGSAHGRQNGENFVAYSPNDQRRRYNASGSYEAQFRMVEDPARDASDSTKQSDRGLKVSITDGVLTQSPTPSPTLEKPARVMPAIKEELYTLGNGTYAARRAPDHANADSSMEAEAVTGAELSSSIPKALQNVCASHS
jgi:hypothetical protein